MDYYGVLDGIKYYLNTIRDQWGLKLFNPLDKVLRIVRDQGLGVLGIIRVYQGLGLFYTIRDYQGLL